MEHIGELGQLLTGIALAGNMLVTLLAYIQGRHNGKQIDAVHEATNSMKDALVATTAKASFAEGVKHAEDSTTKDALVATTAKASFAEGVKHAEDNNRETKK